MPIKYKAHYFRKVYQLSHHVHEVAVFNPLSIFNWETVAVVIPNVFILSENEVKFATVFTSWGAFWAFHSRPMELIPLTYNSGNNHYGYAQV